jgi:hypothetical protein
VRGGAVEQTLAERAPGQAKPVEQPRGAHFLARTGVRASERPPGAARGASLVESTSWADLRGASPCRRIVRASSSGASLVQPSWQSQLVRPGTLGWLNHPSRPHSTDPLNRPTQPTHSTDPLNRPTQPTHSTDPLNRPAQPTHSTDPLNRPTQPTRSTDPLNRPAQPTRSTDPLNRPAQPTRSTDPLNRPAQPTHSTDPLNRLLSNQPRRTTPASVLPTTPADQTLNLHPPPQPHPPARRPIAPLHPKGVDQRHPPEPTHHNHPPKGVDHPDSRHPPPPAGGCRPT